MAEIIQINEKDELLNEFANFSKEKVDQLKSKVIKILNESTFGELEQKRAFIKQIVQNFRLSFQKIINQAIAENELIFNDNLKEFTKFYFWIGQNNYIDLSFGFHLLEDIAECIAISDYENFLQFLENFILPIKNTHQNNLIILLKIANSILKKLSKISDIQLRGRVRIFLTKILSLDDKSGFNAKSIINAANNTKIEDKMELETDINYNFYRKFWSLQKYFQNPILLFQQEENNDLFQEPEINEDQQQEDNGKPKIEKQKRLMLFCEVIEQILEQFAGQPIDLSEKSQDQFEESDSILKKYPKYLTNPNLLNIMMKNTFFRKAFLTQILIFFYQLLSPIKFCALKQIYLQDDEKNKISKLKIKIKQQLDSLCEKKRNHRLINNNTLSGQIKHFLDKDKLWQNWKENGCPGFEKPQNKEFNESLQLINKKQDPKFCKRSEKIKQENLDMMRQSALGTSESTTSLFDYLENQNISISDKSIEPSVGYYFDGIYYQMDPTNEVEDEDKFKSSQIYVWRALRVLARNDLNPIRMELPDNQFEFHLEEICNKMRKEHNKITKQDINKDVMDLRKMKEKVQAAKSLQEAKEAEEAAKKAEVVERERNEKKKIELQEKIKEKESQQQSEKEQGEIKPDKLRKPDKHSKGHSKEHLDKKFEKKSKARKSEDKKYERKHQGMGHKRSPIHSSIPGERHSQKRIHLN